jgi:hypothetical protein
VTPHAGDGEPRSAGTGGPPGEGGCGSPGDSARPESCLEPDPGLIADGWEFRFITDGRRALEAVDLYTELGYEVRTEPARTDTLAEECGGCKSVFAEFLMVYTRKA